MVTSHEWVWLNTMLGHPAADTLDMLRSALDSDQVMDIYHHLIEKARTIIK